MTQLHFLTLQPLSVWHILSNILGNVTCFGIYLVSPAVYLLLVKLSSSWESVVVIDKCYTENIFINCGSHVKYLICVLVLFCICVNEMVQIYLDTTISYCSTCQCICYYGFLPVWSMVQRYLLVYLWFLQCPSRYYWDCCPYWCISNGQRHMSIFSSVIRKVSIYIHKKCFGLIL